MNKNFHALLGEANIRSKVHRPDRRRQPSIVRLQNGRSTCVQLRFGQHIEQHYLQVHDIEPILQHIIRLLCHEIESSAHDYNTGRERKKYRAGFEAWCGPLRRAKITSLE